MWWALKVGFRIVFWGGLILIVAPDSVMLAWDSLMQGGHEISEGLKEAAKEKAIESAKEAPGAILNGLWNEAAKDAKSNWDSFKALFK